MRSLEALLVLVGSMGMVSVMAASPSRIEDVAGVVAPATINEGLIIRYHLNSLVPGRGVCIQMLPTIPGTGWACLWTTNPLYYQITDLLLENYQHRSRTRIEWGASVGGHPEIRMVDGSW